jgi:hypothetical protein
VLLDQRDQLGLGRLDLVAWSLIAAPCRWPSERRVLELTVGSLQVTCSRLGISLRKSSSANGNGAIKPPHALQASMDHIQQGNAPASVKLTLLIKTRNRQTAFDLPLRQGSIDQLALEASVRGQSIADLIGKIVRQALEKDLVGELLRNGNSSSKA